MVRRALTFPHLGAVAGILALTVPHHEAMEVEDFDDDYSKKVAESIYAAIRAFCTPAGLPCDEGLVQHFCRRVRIFQADGASSMPKAAEFLRQHCPNLLVVGRDFAHAIRIACRSPVELETFFGAQWERLFGGEHSIVGDIQYSAPLRARLQACQRRVLHVDGAQGGLAGILKHLSFVQPRFESFVGPRRKFICMIQAIIMLLCSIAADPRVKKPRRDRADAALDALTPQDIIACGLAADFGEVCLSFLRIFDVSFHDPARTLREKREFVHALKVLFLEGHILAAIPPKRGSSLSAAGKSPRRHSHRLPSSSAPNNALSITEVRSRCSGAGTLPRMPKRH